MRFFVHDSNGVMVARFDTDLAPPPEGSIIIVDDDKAATAWKRYKITGVAWNLTPGSDASPKATELAYVILWVALVSQESGSPGS